MGTDENARARSGKVVPKSAPGLAGSQDPDQSRERLGAVRDSLCNPPESPLGKGAGEQCNHSGNDNSKRTPRISVIIPARNEERNLPPVLLRVFEEPVWEVIVVDGGSTDNTQQVATDLGATVLVSELGRGRQLHTGAAAATGDVLLFLHADTMLPKQFQKHVIAALLDPQVAAGAFKLHIDDDRRSFRFIERLVQLRSRYRQMPYGDQAIFMRAKTYHRAGGFPDIPLMEDYDLIRRLRRLGRIRIAPAAVKTSARRWQELGILRATLTNQLCLVAFRLGVSPKRLASWRDRRRESNDIS
ncbi:MAG: TIGR04283 family arsenosugar biosynthesis glycosyltransferase [Planctomycetes bacterium]|nr:TIGR04283 family arsenosugar biosynthesis glycosyltransferase [Planctomycetota bacterium]